MITMEREEILHENERNKTVRYTFILEGVKYFRLMTVNKKLPRAFILDYLERKAK